jgi:hypothetical protein
MPHRHSIALVPGIVLLALWGLVLWLPPDGQSRGEWLQFVGALHPLAVHFPIALVLLVPLLELLSSSGGLACPRAATRLVLLLAAIAATAAPFLGWSLAWSGGYEGGFVTQHMLAGTSLATLCWVCWWLQGRGGTAYAGALVIAVALVGFTGYRGGQLAHGENHLTEHMPGSLRAIFHLPSAAAAGAGPETFFTARIAPIFQEHCLLCHSGNKHKGGLRLDSYAALLKGGKDGLVIKAGDSRSSDLFRRITLPSGDKEAMPAEGKPSLSAEETKLIQVWIAAGASATAPVDSIAGAPRLVRASAPSAPDWRPSAKALTSLAATLGIRLVPRSANPTDGVILRTASAPQRCNDTTLAKLAPIAPFIVEAELARTKVTDAGLKSLVAFSNLQMLDLSHTNVTGSGLGALLSLKKLRTLNLTAAPVDAARLAGLRDNRALTQVYAFH